ncbi:hypothetical protein HK096_000864, partial [Nowakowskiella sp. JEL0078]
MTGPIRPIYCCVTLDGIDDQPTVSPYTNPLRESEFNEIFVKEDNLEPLKDLPRRGTLQHGELAQAFGLDEKLSETYKPTFDIQKFQTLASKIGISTNTVNNYITSLGYDFQRIR